MKRLFPSLESVVGVTAGITAFYLLSVILNWATDLILVLYGASIVGLWWMTIRILKDPYSTDKSFDEFFYQDRDDLKRVDERRKAIGPDTQA